MPSRASKRWALSLGTVAVIAIAAGAALELASDHARDLERIRLQTGGDPARGAHIIAAAGCGACHRIAGVSGARGLVGPPLDTISQRVYIAGRLTNTPSNLAQWIQDPKSVDPLTAMPNTGLSQREARDVVAFLYAHD